jgi:hypothetical protein
MFSTVPFSVTLAPTAPQFAPFSLSTSWVDQNYCGVNFLNFHVLLLLIAL